MKRIIIISLIALVSIIKTNASETYRFNSYIPVLDTLIGYFDLSQLRTASYNEWYESGYESYEIDFETLDQINPDLFSEIEIIIVIGTWCSDSRRETPRFIKITEYLGIDKITSIGVNRAKKAPNTDVENLDIQFVPTFIFYYEGKEIGRIIESPEDSLEKDILTILSAI